MSIRQGPWKLLINNPAAGARSKNSLSEPELYDLATDPGEQNNQYIKNPTKARELEALLTRYREQGYSRPGAKTARGPVSAARGLGGAQPRSKSITSAGSVAVVSVKPASSLTASPSPARSAAPSTTKVPRSTCNQACRPAPSE